MKHAAIAICVVALLGADAIAAEAAPASLKTHASNTRFHRTRAVRRAPRRPRVIYVAHAGPLDAAGSPEARTGLVSASANSGIKPGRFSLGPAQTTVGPYQRPYNPDLQTPDYARIGKSAVGVAVSFKLGS